jgi:hypothetical protein
LQVGLGKTLEIIALFQAMRHMPELKDKRGHLPPVSSVTNRAARGEAPLLKTQAMLIVAPDTLILQWEREIYKSTGQAKEEAAAAAAAATRRTSGA